MMKDKSGAKGIIGYSFLVAFANDRTIDEAELKMFERIALEDGVVDEEEKEALRRIFSRVTQENVSEKVWEEMQQFRNKYQF